MMNPGSIFMGALAFSTHDGTALTERMRITQTGNVGIGNVNPNAPLQFSNATINRKIVLYESGNNDHQFYGFGINGGALRYQTDATNADHVFFAGASSTGSNELMRITGTGRVGIGTSNPTFRLHIVDNFNNGDIITEDSFPFIFLSTTTGGNKGIRFLTGSTVDAQIINWSGSYMEMMEGGGSMYLNNGQLGIGITSPSYDLQLANNSAAKPGSGLWTIPSDSRLKKDVADYNEGLKEIMKIRPVWYTYTGEAEMPQITAVGLIAQELQEVAPHMVKEWTYTPSAKVLAGFDPTQQNLPEHTAAKKNYLAIDGSAITYMTINAIKEQQAQIETLKKQIEEQQKQIDLLLKKQ